MCFKWLLHFLKLTLFTRAFKWYVAIMLYWILFLAFIGVMLAIDLGVFHRKNDTVSVSKALKWTFAWIAMAMLFNVAVYFLYDHEILLGPNGAVEGGEAALEFFTGYIIEKSLSLDNIFVMSAIFAYFKIPNKFQHHVLFLGVLGAIVLRGIFILGGVALVNNFSWIMYVFGFILLVSAVKMFFSSSGDFGDDSMEDNVIVKIARSFLPMTSTLNGKFLVKENGRLFFTPLFVALIVIELSDVLFAVDSIPAIFGITRDPFIVYTSNIMALLGLRHLYFALAAMLVKFDKLKYAMSLVLGFIGVKMMAAEFYEISTVFSLSVISALLACGIIASVIKK